MAMPEKLYIENVNTKPGEYDFVVEFVQIDGGELYVKAPAIKSFSEEPPERTGYYIYLSSGNEYPAYFDAVERRWKNDPASNYFYPNPVSWHEIIAPNA